MRKNRTAGRPAFMRSSAITIKPVAITTTTDTGNWGTPSGGLLVVVELEDVVVVLVVDAGVPVAMYVPVRRSTGISPQIELSGNVSGVAVAQESVEES